MDSRDYIGAVDDFSKAIKKDKKNLNAYLKRGTAKSRSGKYEFDDIIKDYNQAIKLNNKSSDAYLGRYFFYEENYKYSEAIEDLKKAILYGEKNDYFWIYFRRLSDLKVKMNDFSGALSDINEALFLVAQVSNHIFPLGEVYLKKASILFELKRYKEGCDEIDNAQRAGLESQLYQNVKDLQRRFCY